MIKDFCWEVSSSRDLGQELQPDVSTIPRYHEGFWKNWKSHGKASSWEIQATYSDTPLKPTTEECIELQCLKGEQANEKTMWIGFCCIF